MKARIRISLNSASFATSDRSAVSADFEKLAGLGHASAHQAALPGDHGHLAGKFARAVRGDRALAVQGRLHDFHASREQHEERNVRIVGFEQDFAAMDAAAMRPIGRMRSICAGVRTGNA